MNQSYVSQLYICICTHVFSYTTNKVYYKTVSIFLTSFKSPTNPQLKFYHILCNMINDTLKHSLVDLSKSLRDKFLSKLHDTN